MEAHEDVGIGAKGAVNALRERRALVLGAREHHTGVIGPLELGLAGQGDLPVQILLLEAIAERARIATAMTRIERDGEGLLGIFPTVVAFSSFAAIHIGSVGNRSRLAHHAGGGQRGGLSAGILPLRAFRGPGGRDAKKQRHRKRRRRDGTG